MSASAPFGHVSEDATTSCVLAPSYYTDPAVFEFEKRAIFRRSWIFVGHVSQVAKPGDYFPVNILDEPLVVARDRDGQLRAFYNVCAHRAMKVVDEAGNRPALQCPYHGWVYDLTGRLVRVRMGDQMCSFDKAEYGLSPVQIVEIKSLLFANLDPDAQPISETIGTGFDDLTKFGLDPYQMVKVKEIDFEINANWKITIDNYVESYHTELAHPAYSDYADFEKAFVEADNWFTLMGGPPSEKVRKGYEQANRFQVTQNRYNWAWPTTMTLFSPGPPNLSVWQAIPVSYDKTLFRHHVFFDSELLTPEQKEHVQINVGIQHEDTRLVEGVWLGMKSKGYGRQGRYVIRNETQRSEVAVHQFHLRLQEIYDAAGIEPKAP